MFLTWNIGDKIFDGFIINKIITGGMGVIYLCSAEVSRYPVAIKTFIDNDISENEIYSSFSDEIEIWLMLEKHKNIVQAYYVEKRYGKIFLFMEMIDGFYDNDPSLMGFINSCNCSQENILDFSIQICDGLIFAIKKFKEIGRDFVHRDIKPTNILISKNGLVKVTDFGISKVYSNLYNYNKIGDSKELYFSGTLPYMSPEHFIGDSMLDTRSDIYSIGCVIYQMICGKTPFIAPSGLNTSQLLLYYEHHHFKVNPIHPILLNSNCTHKLNSITLKCINKDKNLRYNDFNELRDDLNECYFELKGSKYFGHKYQVEPLNELENELRGYSLYKLGKYVNALSFFNAALTANNGNIKLWFHMGSANKIIGRYDDAIYCYNKILEISPEYEDALNNLANLYALIDQLPMSLKLYNLLLKINPKDPMVWYNTGITYYELGKFEKAIDCYKNAIILRPNYIEALTNIALIFEKLDDNIQANKYWASILKIHSDDPYAIARKQTL